MDRVEEQRLLQQAKQGDADSFAMLYREHVQTIFRYVYHRVSDAQLAEDITGDVFTRALKSMSKYTDRGKPFVAWLYRIAHARVVDHYRRQNRRPNESDIDAIPIAIKPDMDANMMQSHIASTLKQALTALTEDQQQVIVFRFIEGHRLEATAEIMGKNTNAIKALQHRALRALARQLERSGIDIETILAGLS